MSGDDLLHPRLGRIRGNGGHASKLFKAQVLAAAQASRHVGRSWPERSAGRRPGSGRGRGSVAAWRAAERRLSGDRGRRVIVKARVVRQGFRTRTGSLRAHLAYLRREGVSRDGARARLFDAAGDDADAGTFARRAEGDRHHFRFIVAPEDAAEMGDLRAFTRDLAGQMERDLGTRLDWVALDHWNTDNPHVHLIVRGITADGSDLVIHRDYIARGMRERAAELVTLELGPQPEWEVRRKLATEVGAERWTRLDAALGRAAERAEGGVLDFRPAEAGASPAGGGDSHRDLLVGRLQRLERMGLAHPVGPARWRLAEEAEPTLREMGLRGDVIRTMQRAFAREMTDRDSDRGASGYAIRNAADRGTIIGRVVEKGLDDELSGRAYLVVDGVNGGAHYVKFGDLTAVEGVPSGAVVAVGPARVRPADRAIGELAAGAGGIYDPERHRALLEREGRHADPGVVVEGHVRRLEALRRAPGGGLADRLSDGTWKITDDFAARAHAHDIKRGAAAEVEVRTLSELPLERQVTARGMTWLDRELVTREKTELAQTGFGQQVRQALERRTEHLAREGLARRQGQRVVFARDLLDTLRDREVADAVKRVARETGLAHHRAEEGERVSGVYRRRLDLASGRFALIENGNRFVLVPWRPVVERELGCEVSGVVRSGGVSWAMERQRGLDVG